MKPNKILSRKTTFKSKYFYIDKVNLDIKGNKITKDIIIKNPSVFILPLTKDNQIYLVKQYRDALQSESLEVIAGNAEKSTETDMLRNAKRELKEETGLTAKKWKKIATLNFAANMTAYAHIYLAQDLKTGTATPDPDEEIQTLKMPLSETVAKIIKGEIVNSPSISALLLLDKLKTKLKYAK
jgi:8-oxo-dGTP pyrophosphatase MutT (NUDIX family)